MESSSLIIDYLIFISFIAFSFVIPLWGKFRARKKTETKADYVFASGSGVSMGAMMLSIARGTLGVRSFLGYPSELYYRGSAMWETLYGMLLAYPIVCFVFVPVYYSLGITSVYQYLFMRFKSKLVRCLASFSYVIRSLLNVSVTVFTPCVALKTVIGLPYWASICGITAISIVFTLMGGLKAAILSDVIQGLTMIGVSIIIILHGTVDAGGFSTVVNVTSERGRLDFFNFDLDPTIRVTTISAIVGQLFMSLSIFGCQQNFVQRYCSMSSQRKVVKTMMANIPVITVLFSLSWVVGMVIFANYADCDPMSLGYTSKFDEIVPFYVEDKFVYLPGLLGLVMATLFNSSLTITVSILNSLATVTFEDFLSQIPALSNLKDIQQLKIIKALAVFYGFLVIGVSFLVGMLSGVIESSMLMTSATSGPLLGVFVLAMLVPCANWKGAAAGMIFSHVTTLWLTFGRLSLDIPTEALPLRTDGCRNDTFSSHLMKSKDGLAAAQWSSATKDHLFDDETPETVLDNIYSITYMYYALIGSLSTIIVGIVVSLLTADAKADAYEEHLLHPWVLKLSKMTPGRPRLFTPSSCFNENNNINGSVPNGLEESAKKMQEHRVQADNGYIGRLDALKKVTLEVTNEVQKGTKI
ncbi:sodium-coupled monocarboxylate transporter 2 isoform X2 [Copidosoma floridanum]|nr:sodium-coupled monocarboxylate transporter 2 isoform X2 [Copidosoma floridanum]XP_014212877.1 sodium-coupled monocarboxylate transporter 2 isoform X2 [Copidosoma floridanum]XP_014212878.1 sodium-coupled monocarboxylate transporter 2 isoform X2 [Copidosoma floridanum]XP_014212879.1 sodium-coupled monocarboxylate transporter 2 isoform X2 [Copidosoma floridanum]